MMKKNYATLKGVFFQLTISFSHFYIQFSSSSFVDTCATALKLLESERKIHRILKKTNLRKTLTGKF